MSMALPWLESIAALNPAAGSEGSNLAFPKRFSVMFMGCGVNPEHWWAKGNGDDMELGKTLQPLESIKKKVNVIHGLFNKQFKRLVIVDIPLSITLTENSTMSMVSVFTKANVGNNQYATGRE